MKYINKQMAICQVQMVQMQFAMMGYHTMLTNGTNQSTPEVEISVFFEDRNAEDLISRTFKEILKEDETIEVRHFDDNPDGGWFDYRAEF